AGMQSLLLHWVSLHRVIASWLPILVILILSFNTQCANINITFEYACSRPRHPYWRIVAIPYHVQFATAHGHSNRRSQQAELDAADNCRACSRAASKRFTTPTLVNAQTDVLR